LSQQVNLHEIPPRRRLVEIHQKLVRVRSLRTLRSRVCEYLQCGGSEVKEFHYKINGHDWKGIIYLKRNNLMGSIFSLFDNKVFIIRGFPKIRYTSNSRVRDRVCVAEEKVDGTNIGIWAFPDGSIMGKTRMVERWDKGSKRAKEYGSWKRKFAHVPCHSRIYKLAREGFLVYVELYGYHNSGEFVKYTTPMAYKVIGIVNLETYHFLPRPRVEQLCSAYNLEVVPVYYKGTLTAKEVRKMEVDLEQEMALDGMEGLVAKYWDEKDKDSYFCKIKCDRIKEVCWKISRSLIPAAMIRKCIKKALDENLGETRIEIIYPVVVEELTEDFDEAILETSQGKIKGLIRYMTTPSDVVLKARVVEVMKKMKALDVDIENPKKKGEVLSGLHDKLGDIGGGTLFKLYNEVLLEMKGKW